MPSSSLSLLGGQVCTATCRRSGVLLPKPQPGLRPLHASPIFQRPRRRDFFSSNAALSWQRKDDSGHHHPSNPSLNKQSALDKTATTTIPVPVQEQPPLPKRKTARLSGAQASLRRAALEAQRSRDGKQARAPSVASTTNASSPGSSNKSNNNSSSSSSSSSSTAKASNAASSTGPSSAGQKVPKLVTAYAVAETFDVAKVVDILRSNGYEPDPLCTGLYPQVVHIQVPISSLYRMSGLSPALLDPADVGDVFIFPSGTVVTWALPPGFTSYLATRTLLPAATNPHTESIETEDLDYIEDPTRETSSVRGDTFILGTKPSSPLPPPPSSSSSAANDQIQNQSEQQQQQQHQEQQDLTPSAVDTVLTKIAFSSGFARSTKLAVLETMLNTYLASTASIPSILAKGSRLPFRFSRSFILRKTGQLLQLRAQLNLYSELTDSLPDLFWDSRHELNLESYYDQVGRALDVGIRIKVLNEKMDYAAEIASVLRERLSEKHGTFLEWTIIVLIAIEVGFELLRLRKEGGFGSSSSSSSSSSPPTTTPTPHDAGQGNDAAVTGNDDNNNNNNTAI